MVQINHDEIRESPTFDQMFKGETQGVKVAEEANGNVKAICLQVRQTEHKRVRIVWIKPKEDGSGLDFVVVD